MPLNLPEIQGILQGKKAGVNNGVIPKAVNHENAIRFHAETTLSEVEAQIAANRFFAFVRSILPEDKFRMFLTLFRYPVATVPLVERIFSALEKVFDGRNPVFKYEFNSDADAEDWNVYRKQFWRLWRTQGLEAFKTMINSIVVVDLPEEQEDNRPAPYFYFLPIDQVIDFKSDGENGFRWLAFFPEEEGRLAFFDDQFFRLFRTEGKRSRKIVGEPIIETEHGLGYCPARFFWTTPISSRQPHIKKSPITNYLRDLDLALFFDIGNDHLNLYARYPIYSVFADDCDYTNDETGAYCDGGFLRNHEGQYLISGDRAAPCPVCSSKRLDGPGSLIEIDPPGPQNDNADLRNPVQITTIDRASLEYNAEDVEKRKAAIYEGVTGFKGLPINNKAVNEKQVGAIFESLEEALRIPQYNFEQIITWTDETICRLRYGNESFVSASISLGTEHFVLNSTQILSLYEQAKVSTASTPTLDLLEDRYFDTEFRNNPEQLKRQKILVNLDPFRHRTTEEVSAMYNAGQIGFPEFMLKVNFSTLILQFERENLPITQFGAGLDFATKINRIKSALLEYAKNLAPATMPAESLNQ